MNQKTNMAFPKRPGAPMTSSQALERLARLCAASEHSRQEVVDRAVSWGLATSEAQQVADRLVAERFVDDARFAPLFVRDKARLSGWGPVKIKMQLRAKGVADDIATDALDAIDSEEWHEILKHALAQKLRTTRKDDPAKLSASLTRFALQRGFDYPAVRKALNDMGQDGPEASE